MVKLHLPEKVVGDLVPIDWPVGIPFQVVSTHLDLGLPILIDKKCEHVLLYGLLMVQARHEKLGGVPLRV